MNCPNCGTEIDESDRFCQHCGQALSDAREEGKEDTKWETMYRHEYFGNTFPGTLVGDGCCGPYNNKAVESYLNKMFADGWEVINMEPIGIMVQSELVWLHEIAKPLAITGGT